MRMPLLDERHPALLRSAVLATLLGALAWACGSLPAPRPSKPVPREAALAFDEARSWARAAPTDGPTEELGRTGRASLATPDLRATDPDLARERARSAARRAVDLAPDWVAPQRLLDDLARADLLGLELLESYRAQLQLTPDDARLLYLAGRLEGARGGQRFERAVRSDPDLAWGHHGLAWSAAQRGDLRSALAHQERALERARGEAERSYFMAAKARLLLATDRSDDALALLVARLADQPLSDLDQVELSVQATQIELTMLFRPEHARGWERALELLRERDLTDSEVESLVGLMRLYRTADSPGSLEVQQALAARRGPARDRLRAELMLEGRSTPLALGLLRRSRVVYGSPAASGPLLRSARFAAGQYGEAVEDWLADLPGQACTDDGLPADPALRLVVESSRGLQANPAADQLYAFGETLLAAGWFLEARSVASGLAAQDLDRGLDLEERAGAGQALIEGLRRLMNGIDDNARSSARLASTADRRGIDARGLEGGQGREVANIGDLLMALAPLVARAQSLLGGEVDRQRIEGELSASPLVHYGPVGTLVHPGPRFSAADERAGLGQRDEPVPGLAALCARLGRFGLFGELASDEGPDGVLLQRVAVEVRAGEHLGAVWSGTVVLCEGTDVLPRAARRGANIAGAALHEGYWLDVNALRGDRDQWAVYEREFLAPESQERLTRALQSRGLALSAPAFDERGRRRERRDVDMLLGESERVRLAVLRDRSLLRAGASADPTDSQRADGGLVSLDELVEVTGLHEQGHLCDRARFLPWQENLGAIFGLLLESGFSPAAATRLLEYRAELVALCTAPDPRIVMVSILAAVEQGGSLTPHAAGYRELLTDWVATLDRELAAHPERWPALDPDRTLVHQVHLMDPEQVRLIARLLAVRKGLQD